MGEETKQKPPEGEVAGIWFLDGTELIRLAPSDDGNSTVLIRTEEVLILAADLPLPTRRQRLSALPFAIEDQLADPIGDVHVALGKEIAPRRHLAAAVRHAVMADWVERLREAGLDQCSIVPDALSLPVPEDGAWATLAANGRVLVRASDGTAFATGMNQFEALWAAAGKPVCITYGAALPHEVTAVRAVIELEPLTTRLLVPDIDLRQGPYAKPRRAVPISARKVAAIIGFGALAHALIAVLDTFAMQSIAEERRAEAQVLVQQYLPGSTANEELAAEVNELLTRGGSPPRSGFFPLLTRASAALSGSGGATGLRSLSYRADTGELSLDIEQGDVGALERTRGALTNAGLNAVSNNANVQPGGASFRISVRDRPAGEPR